MRAMGRSALLCLGLAGLVLAAFQPALGGEFLNWDDNLIVAASPHLSGFSGEQLRWMWTATHGGHWEPLVWLSFAIDHARSGGMDPAAFHLTGVLLHALNAALVFALARCLLGEAGRGGALLAAALFALHPLRVESVAWVSERRDVLSATLYLTATLLWLRRATGGGRGWLLASYGAFALALTAKAAGLAWPLVFLALDAWPLRRHRDRSWSSLVLEKVPYLVPAVAGVVIASVALEGYGATAMGDALSTPQHLAQAAWGLVFYPMKTLLPAGLSPLYLLDLELQPLSPRYLLSGLAGAGVTVALVLRRQRSPGLLTAWLSYLLLVGPFLGLLSNGIHLTADRYSYVACLPFALLAAAALTRSDGGAGRARLALGLTLALLLGGLTWRQARVWRSSMTLWDRVIAVEPHNYVALNKRGLARAQGGDREGAISDFSGSIEARPRYASAYINRSGQRLEGGDVQGAISDLTQALSLRPGSLEARLNRGLAYLSAPDPQAALADLEAVLKAAPTDWPHRPLAERKAAQARAGG